MKVWDSGMQMMQMGMDIPSKLKPGHEGSMRQNADRVVEGRGQGGSVVEVQEMGCTGQQGIENGCLQ